MIAISLLLKKLIFLFIPLIRYLFAHRPFQPKEARTLGDLGSAHFKEQFILFFLLRSLGFFILFLFKNEFRITFHYIFSQFL